MHPQVAEVIDSLEKALTEVNVMAADANNDVWLRPPATGGWSAAQCVDHLNITSRAMMPTLDDGLSRARMLGGRAPLKMRRDPLGWMIWKSSLPTTRIKVRTGKSFVPDPHLSRDQVVAEFQALQKELLDRAHAAQGLPIHKVKIVSAFAKSLRYSLYSAFSIVAVHQHRHLQQARRAISGDG